MNFIVLFIALVQKEVLGLLEGYQVRPPKAKFGYVEPEDYKEPRALPDSDPDSYWERSGFYQGDIMIYEPHQRNGVLDLNTRWPNATVPFYIEEGHFSDDEVKVILEAIKEYHRYTCMRFKPYREGDSNWIIVTGDQPGCWSSVGMQSGGQELNLMAPNCVRKGTAMHEFLHAMGFYHQQSASNRDDYVKINWDNISDGHSYNFDKYNDSLVTSYGTEYDYESIMHYGNKAFSKNGEYTIESLKDKDMELGQRKRFTDKDIQKLNTMYEETCNKDPSTLETAFNSTTAIMDWFQSLVPNN